MEKVLEGLLKTRVSSRALDKNCNECPHTHVPVPTTANKVCLAITILYLCLYRHCNHQAGYLSFLFYLQDATHTLVEACLADGAVLDSGYDSIERHEEVLGAEHDVGTSLDTTHGGLVDVCVSQSPLQRLLGRA